MKRFNILVIFWYLSCFCLLCTTDAFGKLIIPPEQFSTSTPISKPNNISIKTLSISNLLEVRKDLIRKEGTLSLVAGVNTTWIIKRRLHDCSLMKKRAI